MPVGKGSIARATKAGNKSAAAKVKSVEKFSKILTDISLEQIRPVPAAWREKNKPVVPSDDLIQSIGKYGIIEPVILRSLKDGAFQLLSGYLRVEAARTLKAEFVSARVVEGLDEKEARELYQELHRGNSVNEVCQKEEKAMVPYAPAREMPVYLL